MIQSMLTGYSARKYCLSFFLAIIFIPLYSARATISFENLPDSIPRGDFVVGPGQIEVSLDPGQTKTFELIISNRLGTDKIFSINKEDFAGSQDINQTIVLLGNKRGYYSLKDYLYPDATIIPIKSGQRARVPVTIKIPTNAEPGGLYGSLVVSTVTDATSTDNRNGAIPTNALVTRIASLFFVRVNGQVKESGHVEKFMLANDRKYLFSTKPVAFNIIYRNDGNVSLNPSGSITIKNMLGASVGSIEIGSWFAMPQSLRFRQISWEPNFLFGKYTAHASINRGYDNQKDELQLTFWVFPIKIMLIVLIATIIFVLILHKVLSTLRK